MKTVRAEVKAKIVEILTRHVGKEKAIGMGELFQRVYYRPYRHRINDTRDIRAAITELRMAGALIGETRSTTGGGYYLARSAHELNEFFDRRTHEALKKLYMIACMKKIGLGEMLGQMSLNLSGSELEVRGQRSEVSDG